MNGEMEYRLLMMRVLYVLFCITYIYNVLVFYVYSMYGKNNTKHDTIQHNVNDQTQNDKVVL